MSGNDNSEVLTIYFKEICKYPVLTRERERELSKRISEGNKKAFDELITANLKLVVHIAKKYSGRGLPLEDLISEGNLGLMDAAKRYDYKKEVRFVTYSSWWIKQKILRAIYDKSRTIRIPSNINLLLKRIELTEDYFFEKKGYVPSLKQVSDLLKIPYQKLENILSKINMVSFDFLEDENKMIDFFYDDREDVEKEIIKKIEKEDIKKILNSSLQGEYLEIVKKRFGLDGNCPMSLKEVSDSMDNYLCRESIRNKQIKAIKKIKKNYKNAKILEGYLA